MDAAGNANDRKRTREAASLPEDAPGAGERESVSDSGANGGANSGEDDGNEDEDEDEEEEEDEEEDDNRGAKRRRLRNQFLDVEAEDDDEEDDLSGDEEGLVGEDGFVQEQADNEGDEGQAARVLRQLDRRQEQERFTDEDAERLAEQYRERYGRLAANKYGSGSGSASVPQQLLLPSVEDPPIFGINCRIGREKEAVKAILRKVLSLQHSGRAPAVFSAFQRDGFPGRIYIEAGAEAAALQATAGIPNVFSQSRVLKVPIREYPDMFRVVKKQETELTPGKYVRVKRGRYAGDLGVVVDLSDNGLEARLKLVPRLDYGRTTAISGESAGGARKRADRPPQRLFSSQEAANHDPRSLMPHGANAWTYLGEEYVKGYLHKDFKLGMIEAEDVRPTLAELARFRGDGDEGADIDLSSINDEVKRATAQSTAFAEGERVEVVQGEQTGLQGRITGVNGSDGIIRVRGDRSPYKNLEVSVPAGQLRKHFAVGDHVRVIRGIHKDDTGLVVSTRAGDVTLLSDASQTEKTVFARDLRAASDTTVQNQLAGYAIQDLVQVNAQTVGCIVDVERETVKVLRQDGQVVTLKPESIAMKLRAGGQRHATDARGREVSVGDTVRETGGEQRQGTILHVHHQYVFMHNRERTENLGVFVNTASAIATVSTRAARERGLDLSKMNPNAQAGAAAVAPPPKVAHINTRRIIGQKISIGPGSGYKGLSGIVRDASDTTARVELEARNKVVTVDVAKLLFTNPATKQLVPLREFMSSGRSAGPRSDGGRPPAGGRTPAWASGGKTPAWASGGKTPAWASGGKTPAWASGGKTPAWNSGGKTPAWNAGGKTPAWNAGGKTPAWNAGGKTPAWSAGGKTPAWSADGGKTPAWSATAGSKTPAWSASTSDWDAQTPGGFFSSAPTPGAAATPGPQDDDDDVGYADD